MKDHQRILAMLVMFVFGAIAFIRWYETHLFFFVIVILRDVLAAFYFFNRIPAEIKASKWIAAMAYFSAIIPLCYLGINTSNSHLILAANLFSILGLLLVALATLELGTSIGISPAKRIRISSGVYRLFKHPMYLGYSISELGLCLINPYNIAICFFSIFLYCFRVKHEEKMLSF